MPKKYVKVADRVPGKVYRPNGSEIIRPTERDREILEGAGAAEGTATGGDEGAGAEAEGAGGVEGVEGFVNPEQLATGGAGGAGGRRKPGRPAGAGAATKAGKKEKVQTSLEGIEGILLSIHTIGAVLTKIPELNLAEEEAKKLSQAIGKVASFYDYGASEKTLAWVNLAVCAGGIYGTRMFAYTMRTRTEAEAKRQLAAQQQQAPRPTVLPFQTNGAQAASAM